MLRIENKPRRILIILTLPTRNMCRCLNATWTNKIIGKSKSIRLSLSQLQNTIPLPLPKKNLVGTKGYDCSQQCKFKNVKTKYISFTSVIMSQRMLTITQNTLLS